MSDTYLGPLTTAPTSHSAHHPCKGRGSAQTFALDRLSRHGHHHSPALGHGSTHPCPVKWARRLGRHRDGGERWVGARRPRGWAGTEGTGTVKGGGDAGSERSSGREQKKRGARGTRGERLRETAQEAASVGVLSEDVWATGVFLTQPFGCLPLSRVDVPTPALPGRSHVGCHPCPASQATLLLARRTPVLLTSSADLLCFRGRTQPHPPLPSPGPLGPHFPAPSLPPLLLWTAGPEARACDPAVYLGIQFSGVGESTKERGSQCERLVTATGRWCSIPRVRMTSVSGLSAQGVDGETTYPLVPVPVGSLLSLGPVHE